MRSYNSQLATHRIVDQIRRGGRSSGTVIVFFRIVVTVRPAGDGSLSEYLTVPLVSDVSDWFPMEVSKLPEVAQIPKIAEVALLVVATHVVPFPSELPRHRRRLLFLRVGQQLLDSTATSASSSTTSASGGMTPEVTPPSYLLPLPAGDFVTGQPSRACCPHDRSASDLLPPRPPGRLHHITIKSYPARSSHDSTLPRPPLLRNLELFLVLGSLAIRGCSAPSARASIADTTRNAAGFLSGAARRWIDRPEDDGLTFRKSNER